MDLAFHHHLSACQVWARGQKVTNDRGSRLHSSLHVKNEDATLCLRFITYLLLAIYCHQKFDEKVSIKRVRQLRILIQNQLRCTGSEYQNYLDLKINQNSQPMQNPNRILLIFVNSNLFKPN